MSATPQGSAESRGRFDPPEKPSLELIQSDMDFINNFVANDESLQDELADNPNHEALWREKYKLYKDQETAKVEAKRLLSEEIKNELKLGLDEEALKPVFEKLNKEIEFQTQMNPDKIREFVADWQRHLKLKAEVESRDQELYEEVRDNLPEGRIDVANEQMDVFKKYLEEKKKKKLFFWKTGDTKKLESKIKKELHVDPENVEALKDKYEKVLGRLRDDIEDREKIDLDSDALHVLGRFELSKGAMEELKAVVVQHANKKLFPKGEVKETQEQKGRVEGVKAENNFWKLAEVFTEGLSLESAVGHEANIKEVIGRCKDWAKKRKEGEKLSNEEKQEYINILKDAVAVAKNAGIFSGASESENDAFFKNFEAVITNAEKKPEAPVVPAENKEKTKPEDYLQIKDTVSKYFDRRKKELVAKGSSEQYAQDFFGGVEDYTDFALEEIQKEVARQLTELKHKVKGKDKTTGEDLIKERIPSSAKEEMVKGLQRVLRLVGTNERGQTEVKKHIVEELDKLVKDPELKGKTKRMLVVVVLNEFKKL